MDDDSTFSPADGVPEASDSQLAADAEICNRQGSADVGGSCRVERKRLSFDGPYDVEEDVVDEDVGEEESGEATRADLLGGPHGEQVRVRPAPALPEVLERRSRERWRAEFLTAYRPVGPTETVLVEELARHAAAAEFWDQGSGAVGRRTAELLADWVDGRTAGADADEDAALAGVAMADSLDRCDKHSRAHGRAFLRTLAKLESLQTARREQERVVGDVVPPLGFTDEEDCEHYLAARFAAGEVPCAKCGGTAGCLIPSRKCWECRRCKRQVGYRVGTVMAHSPLPLRLWFAAVRLLLWRPRIEAVELAGLLGIERLTTVREMKHRIRAALDRPQTGAELAGLDRHFAAMISPALSARREPRPRRLSGERPAGSRSLSGERS
jgi:hypothetical protein